MSPQPTPAHERFAKGVAPERNEQAPLGPQPSYDEVLDTAVEYTFPASDPVSVDSACNAIADRDGQAADPQRR
ncbi:hypothetical protein [Ramlibacter sp.]|uniref:hypothetical protein n=1 Tax=Ramlibacter sp. TaxID=1917967 RepID=UPI002D69BC80|nr:hypothetical protein [Ramlibacter sp.]HYD77241.1 hypothetical protein [Ramlibacter sp.]